jgi:hypothetical protein
MTIASDPTTSLRGALATKQSIPPFARLDGLLRGACHRARIRATRWLAMTRQERATFSASSPANARRPVRCGFSVLSLTSLEYWIARSPATPTAFVRRRTSAVKRLRRGSAVVVRRSVSEGGKPRDDGAAMTNARRIRATRWLAMTGGAVRSSWICCAVTHLRRPSRISNPGTDDEPLSECIALPVQAGLAMSVTPM